jgi:hypothetical protein
MNRIRVVLSHESELAPSVDGATGLVVLSEKDQEDTGTYVLRALAVHAGRGRVRRLEHGDLPCGEERLEREVAVRIPRQQERFADAFLKGLGLLVRELSDTARSAKGGLALDLEFEQEDAQSEGGPGASLRLVARLISVDRR